MVEYVPLYIEHPVIEDLKRKMVFIGGPRQTGNTTLAKSRTWSFDCLNLWALRSL